MWKLYYNKKLSIFLLLLPLLLWLGLVYLGSLFTLLLNSFYSVDDFSGVIVRDFTLNTFKDLLGQRTNLDIIFRTVAMASSVTITCILIAFPIALFMYNNKTKFLKPILYLGIMLPLWSSYLVKVYAWKLILAKQGIINFFVELTGTQVFLDSLLSLPVIGGTSLSFSYIGIYLVFVYMWLPYMILPIYASLQRIPINLILASEDLGATPSITFRKIIIPLVIPGVIAGSIFTFSLTLGDYIVPTIIGNSSYFIGMAVYTHQGTAGNIPLAAAFSIVPIIIMLIYLMLAKKVGAFDAL
ncbi:MAG: ABC transporter permease [Spirochaetia bacterium]|nr:ABC transporter permease [Spirochaetia bacterium]